MPRLHAYGSHSVKTEPLTKRSLINSATVYTICRLPNGDDSYVSNQKTTALVYLRLLKTKKKTWYSVSFQTWRSLQHSRCTMVDNTKWNIGLAERNPYSWCHVAASNGGTQLWSLTFCTRTTSAARCHHQCE